jgi:cysteinyl-tRNA synthetase
MDALGALRPNHEPRATDFIGAMVDMINELILRGNAYEAEGHVLFAVDSYDAYGALSGRSLDDMIAGSRVEVAPYKRNPMDFVLWKPSGAGQPGWDSPWGVGRPGWHIECSAMSRALLGPAFDIHGGGNDLLFPHHENEIAQSCCADPEAGFATYWLHNEMLQVEGKKMSKSLGNFFTVRDLLDEGISGEVIRLVMLGTHYGKPMDWTAKKRDDADATLRRWYGILAGHGFGPALIKALKADGQWEPDAEFLGVLANDLNTPGAIARLHVLAKGKTPAQLAGFAHGLDLLGLVPDWADLPRLAGGEGGAQVDDAIAQRIDALLDTRAKARASKDWDMADRVRDILTAAGVVVTDVGGQASWAAGPEFDAAALVDL